MDDIELTPEKLYFPLSHTMTHMQRVHVPLDEPTLDHIDKESYGHN